MKRPLLCEILERGYNLKKKFNLWSIYHILIYHFIFLLGMRETGNRRGS